MLLPEFAATSVATQDCELLELPEHGLFSALVLRSTMSEMLEVDDVETVVTKSTEPPNLKKGPAEFEGFAANPKMLPLGAAEVLVLVPVGTMFETVVEEVN